MENGKNIPNSRVIGCICLQGFTNQKLKLASCQNTVLRLIPSFFSITTSVDCFKRILCRLKGKLRKEQGQNEDISGTKTLKA